MILFIQILLSIVVCLNSRAIYRAAKRGYFNSYKINRLNKEVDALRTQLIIQMGLNIEQMDARANRLKSFLKE